MTYRVESEIGRGGMAVVYAGRQDELDRPVALKVLAAHLADDPEFRARFLREARIAARLDHPNLVRTYDVTEIEGRPAIVMELLPGDTLEGGALSRVEAAGVAAALAHAHAQGVVHRDLKPANLLRAADGTVKIGDFGIARAAEETMVTQVGTVLGTLRYLAPEQAEGKRVGPAADVYSLGVVFDDLVPDVDRALTKRMRDPDPQKRPATAEVAAALAGGTTSATYRSIPTARIALLLAAAALIVAALVLAFTHGSKKPAPPSVRPVPHSSSATQQARNLEAWLKSYSR